MDKPPSFIYALALERLLTADTWEKKRKVLEEEQELLLTPETIDLLNLMVEEAESSSHSRASDDWISSSVSLLMYRALISNARTRGTRQAWGLFMMWMKVSKL